MTASDEKGRFPIKLALCCLIRSNDRFLIVETSLHSSVLSRIPCSGLPEKAFMDIWIKISSLPASYRKSLVLLCRAQFVPNESSTTLLALQAYPDSFRNRHGYTDHDNVLRDIVANYEDLIQSALFSGLLLDMCRSSPMDIRDINEEHIKSWGKEYSVCTRHRLPHRINFRVLFDPQYRNESITPYVAPNPMMASYCYATLIRWRDEVCSKIHFPRVSAKQSSYSTQRNWESLTGQKWVNTTREGGVEFNQRVLERFYHETGVHIPGDSEMRQKWYKSGTSPRTYFAQGGTHYEKSKYTQEMFLDLVDLFNPTNHVSRLNPSRIMMIHPDDYLRIYDLSSFTSNCHEQMEFISHLATFCSGWKIRLFDSCYGEIEEDLGVLISEYNQICNNFPKFSVERIDKGLVEAPISHSNASFLGVYGNLASCTALHGLVVVQACDTPDDLNIAGDDGHFREKPGFEDISTDLIRSIGVVERSKEFDSREEGAVCLKRGLYQHGLRIFQKLMVIWPSFHTLGSLLGFRSPQFSPFDSGLSRDDFRDMVGNEMLRFLSHLYYAQVGDNLDVVLWFLREYWNETSLPEYGCLPQCGSRYLCPVLPTSPEDILNEHPLEKLTRVCYNGSAMVCVEWTNDTISDEGSSIGFSAGFEWRGRMTKYLAHMQNLGFLRSEKLKEFVWGEVGLDKLRRDFDPDRVPVYDFLMLADVPPHLQRVT